MTKSNPSMLPGDFDPKSAYGRLLSHPRVSAFLAERVAAYSLPYADAQDLVAIVFATLWHRRSDENPPDNLPRLLGLAGVVFEGKLVDYFRRKEVSKGRIVDGRRLTHPEADSHHFLPHQQPNYVDEIAPPRSMNPEHALGAKEQLAFVQTQVEKGVITRDDIEVMQAQHARERTLEELATERGVRADALRQRLHRVRVRMLKAWAEFSLITKTSTILFLILLFLVVVTVVVAALRRREPPPPPEPPPAPTQLQPPAPPRAPVRESTPPSDPPRKSP